MNSKQAARKRSALECVPLKCRKELASICNFLGMVVMPIPRNAGLCTPASAVSCRHDEAHATNAAAGAMA